MRYHTYAMGTGDRLAIVPVSSSGASVVVPPVEGDGCIFTTQIDCGLVRVAGVVGVSRGKRGGDQSPLAGKIALDLETLGLGNYPVKDEELGNLTLICGTTSEIESFGVTVGVVAYALVAGNLDFISPGIGNV